MRPVASLVVLEFVGDRCHGGQAVLWLMSRIALKLTLGVFMVDLAAKRKAVGRRPGNGYVRK